MPAEIPDDDLITNDECLRILTWALRDAHSNRPIDYARHKLIDRAIKATYRLAKADRTFIEAKRREDRFYAKRDAA